MTRLPPVGSTARAAAAGAAGGQLAWRLLAAPTPGAGPWGGRTRWERRNHRGRAVTLLEGPAYAAGAVVGVATAPGLPRDVRRAALLATIVCAAVGGYDDLHGGGGARGLAGHLGALARGEVTTGTVKILAMGAGGLAAAALVRGDRLDAALAGGVVAGAANLLNLFDLRPGRATKAALAVGGPLVARGGPAAPAVAAGLGAAVALLPAELRERGMLGDAGANALGALVGLGIAAGASRRRLAAALGVLGAATAASELVSFSRVIDAVPPLRWLDRLGRLDPP